jgi:hypothetical protein
MMNLMKPLAFLTATIVLTSNQAIASLGSGAEKPDAPSATTKVVSPAVPAATAVVPTAPAKVAAPSAAAAPATAPVAVSKPEIPPASGKAVVLINPEPTRGPTEHVCPYTNVAQVHDSNLILPQKPDVQAPGAGPNVVK